jgi:hypothetical protein
MQLEQHVAPLAQRPEAQLVPTSSSTHDPVSQTLQVPHAFPLLGAHSPRVQDSQGVQPSHFTPPAPQ